MVASREKEIKEINRFMLFWLGKLKLTKLIVLSCEFDVTWSTVPLLVKLVVVFVFVVVVRISVVEFLVEGISAMVVAEVVVEMFAEVKLVAQLLVLIRELKQNKNACRANVKVKVEKIGFSSKGCLKFHADTQFIVLIQFIFFIVFFLC